MEAFSLTARQHQQLEMVLHETCDSRVYRRVLGILEVSQGASVEEVAQTLGVTRQSVYNWLSRFDSKECWGSLIDRPRSGRPRLLREHRQAWLKDMMRQRPDFVHEHYRGWHMVWLLDSDSSHTAAGSQRLGKKFNMEFLWLPKRSPELNPLDHLRGHGKDEICGNRQYETIDGQVKKFITYLTSLSPQEVLRKAGVLSEDFWLTEVL